MYEDKLPSHVLVDRNSVMLVLTKQIARAVDLSSGQKIISAESAKLI